MTQMPTGAIPRWVFVTFIWTKDRCGLAKTRLKDKKGPEGTYVVELTPEKEAAIRTVFIHFGLIKNE